MNKSPFLVRSGIYFLLIVYSVLFLPISLAHAQQESSPQSPVVILETNQGNIELTLFRDKAPKAVENFIGLVKEGFYNNLIFHRVVRGLLIQGGDPTGTGSGGTSLWGEGFADEICPDLVFNKKGILAMVNSGPNTNGSQFFIMTAPNHSYNGQYTIFGNVSQGFDVVQKIENTPTGSDDRPLQDQRIIKAYVQGSLTDDAKTLADFQAKANVWRASAQKPPLPEEARRFRVLADDAVANKNFMGAANFYEQGLAIDPMWLAGQFNAAIIYAELKIYPMAIMHMKYYLALKPDAKDAESDQDKIYIWEEKVNESK